MSGNGAVGQRLNQRKVRGIRHELRFSHFLKVNGASFTPETKVCDVNGLMPLLQMEPLADFKIRRGVLVVSPLRRLRRAGSPGRRPWRRLAATLTSPRSWPALTATICTGCADTGGTRPWA